MLSELGLFFLAMALGFGVVQILASWWGVLASNDESGSTAPIEAPRNNAFLILGRVTTYIQGGFVLAAFLTLMTAFFMCDFSLMTVALHDHINLPWYYRLAATWGNHEGSLLLFVLILSGMGVALALFLKDPLMRARALTIQGLLTLLFLIFLMITSNPFEALPYPLLEGQSLNPLLQDRGLVFHPPLLYLGYVGFSAPYALAIAALWGQEEATAWETLVRPWVLFAWGALTAGITLGSWWAYYELGWGGWWFWDPVENASLMPWLAGTALLHTLRTGRLYRWSLLLCLVTFGLSLLGTFLVRSGLITSVHSFAQSPERGVFILSLIGVIMGFAFLMWTWRAPRLQSSPLPLLTRGGALLLNSLLLSLGLGTILLGTLYPLWSEWMYAQPLAIGTPYFERTFIPLMIPLLLLIPIGSLLRSSSPPGPSNDKSANALSTNNSRHCEEGVSPTWQSTFFIFKWIATPPSEARNDEAESIFQLLITPLTAALGAAALVLFALSPTSISALIGIIVAVWVFVGTLLAFLKKRLSLGPTLAHIGVAISLLGVSAAGGFKVDASQILGLQDKMKVGGVELTLEQVNQGKGSTYFFEKAILSYPEGILTPEKRLYKPQDSLLSETAITTNGFRDLYVILGPYQGESRWLIRGSVIPLAPWIWIGGAFMVFGALVSFFRKRPAFLLMLMLMLLPFSAQAGEINENRAKTLQQEVRCPVCMGQSIYDSESDESIALKIYILEELNKGKSEEEIREKLRETFGDEILFRPPFDERTFFLWLAPFGLFFFGLSWVLWRILRTRTRD